VSFAEREELVREILEEISGQMTHGIAVALLTEDQERLAILQKYLESTNVALLVFSNLGFPVSANDPIVGQLQKSQPEVVIVDIDSKDARRAIHAIELVRDTASKVAIFTIGEMHDPTTIVAAMRSGAVEFVDRTASPGWKCQPENPPVERATS